MLARIALLSIASLMLAYVGFRDPNADSPFFSGSAGFPAVSLQEHPAWQPDAELDPPMRAEGVVAAVSIKPHMVDLERGVAPHLRDAVWATDAESAAGALHLNDSGASGFASVQTLAHWFDARFAACLLAFCAFLVALRGYWLREIRDDLHELTASLSLPLGHEVTEPACHPRELHGLARALGDLLQRRSSMLEDQSECFGGFLRQIESRAARLRAYAMNVARWNLRVALVEDIDHFQDVARQFVETAGGHGAIHAPVGVEAWLKDRFIYGAMADDARIVVKLEAGDAFQLPRSALTRLVENLVGNALAHGAPPVEIRTARGARAWVLSVRDHGSGIGAGTLDDTPLTTPSSAAGLALGAHWGIGLSIVRRLAQRCNATLKIGDHPDGGLCVRVIVPMDHAQQD
ncbi:HAMP domain-containing sensor histidine kinase [Paraburkholderia sp. Ac-20340]|uniref:sensor histidine kinase n=1 Tax=Paraburkholderia sp. Ac-20340 TaxID=2703888 RepID=UPI00197F6FE2|nr:HAMP domain-containing sensor histidine kinase [Paraburkholderia sp. Ac-20340]